MRANAARPREKRVLEYGWTQDGGLWLAARIPLLVSSYMFSVPLGIRRIVSGQSFLIEDSEGVECGSLRIDEGGLATGLTPFLLKRGADEDDIVLIEFDLPGAKARVHLTDDDLLEELSPAM